MSKISTPGVCLHSSLGLWVGGALGLGNRSCAHVQGKQNPHLLGCSCADSSPKTQGMEYWAPAGVNFITHLSDFQEKLPKSSGQDWAGSVKLTWCSDPAGMITASPWNCRSVRLSTPCSSCSLCLNLGLKYQPPSRRGSGSPSHSESESASGSASACSAATYTHTETVTSLSALIGRLY